MNKEEIDDYLDRYYPFIDWVNEVIKDVYIEGETSEETSGHHLAMIINKICNIHVHEPIVVCDLKRWYNKNLITSIKKEREKK